MPITSSRVAASAPFVAMIGLPAVMPLPAKKSLMRPPASWTITMPAPTSQALMCSSQ